MKKHLVILLLAALSLNTVQATERCNSDTLIIPAEMEESYDVYTSEDGNMSFYVWGGCHDFTDEGHPNNIACRIKTSDGSSRTFLLPEDNEIRHHHYWITGVHSIKKNDGTTFYIVPRMFYCSTSTSCIRLDAFVIVGDTIEEYEDIPYMVECMSGGDIPKIEYDPKNKEIYVPLIIDIDDTTDHYTVYKFNGSCFVEKEGAQPQMGLHSSLHQYKNLVMRAKTDSHLIRIDRLEDGSLRYASWNKELQQKADISKQPDIILYNGVYNEETNEYTFRNGNFSYTINNNFDYLVVKYNGKEQTKYRIHAPY